MRKDNNNSDRSRSVEDGVSRRDFISRTTAATFAATLAPFAMAETNPQGGMQAASATFPVSLPKLRPLPTDKKLRLGVVGGNFGISFPWHLHPNCEVTAVADLFSDRRDRMKQTFQCDNAYEEFHPMLKDPKVDAVAIYTYGNEHAKHCIDVMKAGKHVMNVIPAAISLEECQDLIDTVKSTGQIYLYGETGCFHPSAMAARKFNEEGKFGHVYFTEGEYLHSAYSNVDQELEIHLIKDGKRTWRWGFPQGLYGGHAIGPVIHTIKERFVEVAAIGMEYQNKIFKENEYGNPFVNTTFFYKTFSGNASNIKVHWLSAVQGNEGADIIGTDMSLFEARGDLPDRVSFPNESSISLDLSAYRDVLPNEIRSVKGHGDAHAQIINEFVRACLEERKPFVDVYSAAAISAAGIVGFHSALKGGELLKIPDFGAIT